MRTAEGGPWLRMTAVVVLVVLGLVVAGTVDLPSVATVRSWLAGTGVPGLVVLAVVLGVVLIASVPRTALSVLVGAVAGFWPGLAVALAGAVLGGLLAFGLSRRLGRDAVVRLAGPRIGRLDRVLADRGFVAVLGARLLPVVPFTLLSYAAGLTGVRLLPYLLATALGTAPGTVVQVAVGASAGGLVSRAGGLTLVCVALLAVAVAATVLHRRRRGRAAVSGDGRGDRAVGRP